MSGRAWSAIYSDTLHRAKYRRLSFAARGALLHIWMLAGTTTPEATWHIDELRDLFGLDGAPAGALDELIAGRWVDVDGETATVHDWDEWQLAASYAIRNDFEADRKREWRRRSKPSPPVPPSPTGEDTTGQDIRPDDVRTHSDDAVTASLPRGNGALATDGSPDNGTTASFGTSARTSASSMRVCVNCHAPVGDAAYFMVDGQPIHAMCPGAVA